MARWQCRQFCPGGDVVRIPFQTYLEAMRHSGWLAYLGVPHHEGGQKPVSGGPLIPEVGVAPMSSARRYSAT